MKTRLLTPEQWTLLLIAIAVGVLCAALSFFLSVSTEGIAAVLSVMVLAYLITQKAAAAYAQDVAPDEYFGASSTMRSSTTLQSLGSTWIMLGNVVVAGMFLGQLFGFLAAWVVFTWSLAFILMANRVARIRSVLSSEDTLHTFLHKIYDSQRMRQVAAVVTAFVGLGVFSTELVAGMALLVAVLPAAQASYAVPILILLLVLTMASSVIAGGLRAVINTDASLWPLVIISVALLGAFVLFPYMNYVPAPGTVYPHLTLLPKEVTRGVVAIFLIGVAALQVPLLLGDYGTWQRVKATDLNDEGGLVRHTLRQAGWQAFLWGVPIAAGVALSVLPPLYQTQSGNLYASGSPLIEATRHWLQEQSVPQPLRILGVTLFLIGMLGIMISTANSYLIIATETIVRDFLGVSDKAYGNGSTIRRARLLCAFIALAGCAPIAALVASGMNLLGIIIIVFSVQVALAPPAILAVYQPREARQISTIVTWSTIGAFVAAIAYGLLMTYGPVGEWWQAYGPYLTAVVALAIPSVAIFLSLLAKFGVSPAIRFLGTLFLLKPPGGELA